MQSLPRLFLSGFGQVYSSVSREPAGMFSVKPKIRHCCISINPTFRSARLSES